MRQNQTKTTSSLANYCRTIKTSENVQRHLLNGYNWNTFNVFKLKANNEFHKDLLFQPTGSLRSRKVAQQPMVNGTGSFMIKTTQISNWCLKPDSLYWKIQPQPALLSLLQWGTIGSTNCFSQITVLLCNSYSPSFGWLRSNGLLL